MHQFGQRPGGILLAMQRIGHKMAHIVEAEWRKYDFYHARSGLADCVKGTHQRMGGTDFVVPVSTHKKQVLHFLLGDEVLEQFKGRRI